MRLGPSAPPEVQQYFAAAEANEWKYCEDLAEMARRYFSGVTETKIIEDSVREERVAEVNVGFCKRVSGERTWDVLIKSKPLGRPTGTSPWSSPRVPT